LRTVSGCPVERTLRIIGGKWTLLVLRDLFTGKKRFGELLTSLEGVSPKTLSDRLKELEGEGIITKTVFPEVPPRVEYALTEKGLSLWEILEAMRRWGDRWPLDAPQANTSLVPD
jgi:DNA-binding HxlR family transcriptional regulator